MQTIETTNPIEARRARYAQYRGQKATLTLMGTTVTGLVRSVNEKRVRDVQAMDRHGGCEVGHRPAVFIPVV